jgi:hypothetical protein
MMKLAGCRSHGVSESRRVPVVRHTLFLQGVHDVVIPLLLCNQWFTAVLEGNLVIGAAAYDAQQAMSPYCNNMSLVRIAIAREMT